MKNGVTKITYCHKLNDYMFEKGLADPNDSYDPECDYQLETKENCTHCGVYEMLKERLEKENYPYE